MTDDTDTNAAIWKSDEVIKEWAMPIRCADCGCVVARGLRLTLCGDPSCCCAEPPVRQPDPSIRSRET